MSSGAENLLHAICKKCSKPIHQWERGQAWYHDEIDVIEWWRNREAGCDAEPVA